MYIDHVSKKTASVIVANGHTTASPFHKVV